jgi:hypothetical protein
MAHPAKAAELASSEINSLRMARLLTRPPAPVSPPLRGCRRPSEATGAAGHCRPLFMENDLGRIWFQESPEIRQILT